MAKRGLYSNIQAKRKRIAAGSGEKMPKALQPQKPLSKQLKQLKSQGKSNGVR